MIEPLITQVAAEVPCSSGDNLLGFEIDTVHALLNRSPAFKTADVTKTNDPMALIHARIEIQDDLSGLGEVEAALGQVFQMIAYRYFSAMSIRAFQEAVVLRFVTVVDGRQFFVSGRMVATGGSYPSLVRKFETGFPTTLPSDPNLA